MVKHIVCWKLKATKTKAEQTQIAQEMKAALESLRGRVPSLLNLEVGIGFNTGDGAYDVVLLSEFASQADLAAYKDHPAQVGLARRINEWKESRIVVDYEVG